TNLTMRTLPRVLQIQKTFHMSSRRLHFRSLPYASVNLWFFAPYDAPSAILAGTWIWCPSRFHGRARNGLKFRSKCIQRVARQVNVPLGAAYVAVPEPRRCRNE